VKAFIWFIALLAAAAGAIATLTYPLWAALYPHFGFPFHRVADRVGLLAFAVGFVLVVRRLKLADRASLGYGAPPPVFLREIGLGFLLGAPMMALVVAVMVALGLLEWKPGVALGASSLLAIAGVGLARGFAVALIEETFLRGAMFTGIARESGVKAAVILTALLYAASHFVGHSHAVDAAPGWGSGLALLAASFGEFAHPFAIGDAYLSLFAVGAVLAMVRAETGHIGACIGLHASWVWVITFVRETSVANRASPLAFLLSRFDGVVGWLVLGWTVLLGIVLYAFYSRRQSRRGPLARTAG
jgi:hypothetical protein